MSQDTWSIPFVLARLAWTIGRKVVDMIGVKSTLLIALTVSTAALVSRPQMLMGSVLYALGSHDPFAERGARLRVSEQELDDQMDDECGHMFQVRLTTELTVVGVQSIDLILFQSERYSAVIRQLESRAGAFYFLARESGMRYVGGFDDKLAIHLSARNRDQSNTDPRHASVFPDLWGIVNCTEYSFEEKEARIIAFIEREKSDESGNIQLELIGRGETEPRVLAITGEGIKLGELFRLVESAEVGRTFLSEIK